MSTAPKTRGLDKRIVYGLVAVIAVMVLLCAGIFFAYLMKNLNLFGGGGGITPTQGGVRGKRTFREDAVLKPQEAAQAFLGALCDEEYGQALRKYGSIGFQGRYSPTTLRELVEREGKGLIGFTVQESLNPVGQSPEGRKFRGEVGGGSYGPVRFEITVFNDSEGWRVNDFIILKK
jgi:hypothetical protein